MRAKVSVNLRKIKENLRIIKNNCAIHGASLAIVTKAHSADIQIAKAIFDEGISAFADSRIENLEALNGFPCEKWLLRVPAKSIVEETVAFSDLSFNSEISIIKLLNAEAKRQNKTHKIVLMWDLGDLREGYFNFDDLLSAAKEVQNLECIEFCGIATNLNCYGGVDPTVENMLELSGIAEKLAKAGFTQKIISGGGSSTYSLIINGTLPKAINNLRIGDTLYLGRDRLLLEKAEGMHDDCFVLTAEAIEVKDKPSMPIGSIGVAALNAKPVFVDRGVRKRAIFSVGKQDIDLDLSPITEGAILLGASSDHLIVDVTDVKGGIKPGDLMSFKMGYSAILRSFTSKYIDKDFLDA